MQQRQVDGSGGGRNTRLAPSARGPRGWKYVRQDHKQGDWPRLLRKSCVRKSRRIGKVEKEFVLESMRSGNLLNISVKKDGK